MVMDTCVKPSKTAERVDETLDFKWCNVSLSDIIGMRRRLEASIFDPEVKKSQDIMNNIRYGLKPICGENGIAEAYTCSRFKRLWVEKSKYPIFQPSSVMAIKPKPDGFISPNTKTDIEDLRVHEGQVLLTCSGTIGKVAYVSKTLNNAIVSHDLLRITCYKPYDEGFLYAFLKSEIGNKILLSNQYGAVINHIEASHLETISIPNAPVEVKKRIDNLIKKSYALRDASNNLINKAESILLSELHLPPLENFIVEKDQVDTFSVKLSETKNRLDGSYHIPLVNKITNHLKQYAKEVTTISDERISKKIILPGRFKRVYVNKKYGSVFIGGKQIHELDPNNKKYLSTVCHADLIANQITLHENMILITCSGTIGKTLLVGKQWEGWTANQHIIRIVPANMEVAGYISIFLGTEYGNKLITRNTYGSVVDEIDLNQVASIAVPLIKNQSALKQINGLALQANNKRYEAYKLEQEAIKIMNKEILNL